MKSQIVGASIAPANQGSTAHLRMPMAEAEIVPDPVSISWTRAAHERSAEQRRARIAVVAYYLSGARGFAPDTMRTIGYLHSRRSMPSMRACLKDRAWRAATVRACLLKSSRLVDAKISQSYSVRDVRSTGSAETVGNHGPF